MNDRKIIELDRDRVSSLLCSSQLLALAVKSKYPSFLLLSNFAWFPYLTKFCPGLQYNKKVHFKDINAVANPRFRFSHLPLSIMPDAKVLTFNMKVWKYVSFNQKRTCITFNEKRKVFNTAQNTKILPNFLVWKFCGKAQFPQSFGQIAWNSTETVHFQKISTPWNYVKFRYFTQCMTL